MGDNDIQRIYDKIDVLRTEQTHLQNAINETTFHVKAMTNRLSKVEKVVDEVTSWKSEEIVTRKLITKVLAAPLYLVALLQALMFLKQFYFK